MNHETVLAVTAEVYGVAVEQLTSTSRRGDATAARTAAAAVLVEELGYSHRAAGAVLACDKKAVGYRLYRHAELTSTVRWYTAAYSALLSRLGIPAPDYRIEKYFSVGNNARPQEGGNSVHCSMNLGTIRAIIAQLYDVAEIDVIDGDKRKHTTSAKRLFVAYLMGVLGLGVEEVSELLGVTRRAVQRRAAGHDDALFTNPTYRQNWRHLLELAGVIRPRPWPGAQVIVCGAPVDG